MSLVFQMNALQVFKGRLKKVESKEQTNAPEVVPIFEGALPAAVNWTAQGEWHKHLLFAFHIRSQVDDAGLNASKVCIRRAPLCSPF